MAGVSGIEGGGIHEKPSHDVAPAAMAPVNVTSHGGEIC
jgi:hypothetical protein